MYNAMNGFILLQFCFPLVGKELSGKCRRRRWKVSFLHLFSPHARTCWWQTSTKEKKERNVSKEIPSINNGFVSNLIRELYQMFCRAVCARIIGRRLDCRGTISRWIEIVFPLRCFRTSKHALSKFPLGKMSGAWITVGENPFTFMVTKL